MNGHRRVARIAAIAALCVPGFASAIESCYKNHYILDEPCTTDWTAANAGLANLDVRVVTIDPVTRTTLYAGGAGGVFKSLDGGSSWRPTGMFLIPQLPSNHIDSAVAHVAIDPTAPETLYAGTVWTTGCAYFQRRLFKSSDGGESWNDVGPALNGCDNIHSLRVAPSDPATLYVASFDDVTGDTPFPIVRSTDKAQSWTDAAGWVYFNVLSVDPLDSRKLYGGKFGWDGGGVAKSGDGGATWTASGLAGSGISTLVVDRGDTRTLYAATVAGWPNEVFGGVFKSVDGGQHWTAANNGLDSFLGTRASVASLVIDPVDSNAIYLGLSNGGVARSVDAGATWTPFNDGLETSSIRSLAIAGAPRTLYAGTPRGVFKIVDTLTVLSLQAPRSCLGDPWTVRLSKAAPNMPARLYGTRNGVAWESDWQPTDDGGRISESGTFAFEGTYTLRVFVAGAFSNSVKFEVSDCSH